MLLPAWERGIREGVRRPPVQDFFRFGLYTGMRRGEVLALRWDRVALEEGRFSVDETKSGERLELPVTRQLAAILSRRWEANPSGASTSVPVATALNRPPNRVNPRVHLAILTA